MLKTLTVWNFALLEHVEIDFDAVSADGNTHIDYSVKPVTV